MRSFGLLGKNIVIDFLLPGVVGLNRRLRGVQANARRCALERPAAVKMGLPVGESWPRQKKVNSKGSQGNGVGFWVGLKERDAWIE